MAGKKRRRTYTFMSQMPLPTQTNNEIENVNTDDVTVLPPTVASTQLTREAPSQLDHGQSQVDSTPLSPGDFTSGYSHKIHII